MNNKEEKGGDVWSEWLDFDHSNIDTTTTLDKPGVFKVHANMKILFIGIGPI